MSKVNYTRSTSIGVRTIDDAPARIEFDGFSGANFRLNIMAQTHAQPVIMLELTREEMRALGYEIALALTDHERLVLPPKQSGGSLLEQLIRGQNAD